MWTNQIDKLVNDYIDNYQIKCMCNSDKCYSNRVVRINNVLDPSNNTIEYCENWVINGAKYVSSQLQYNNCISRYDYSDKLNGRNIAKVKFVKNEIPIYKFKIISTLVCRVIDKMFIELNIEPSRQYNNIGVVFCWHPLVMYNLSLTNALKIHSELVFYHLKTNEYSPIFDLYRRLENDITDYILNTKLNKITKSELNKIKRNINNSNMRTIQLAYSEALTSLLINS